MSGTGTTARAPAEQGPRSLSWTELALAYAPDLSEASARKRLREWLHFSPELMERLQAAGYRERQRVLTPKQVKIIMEHLGEP